MSRVLLGISGGIAAYKACELVRLLVRAGHEVRVVATPHALEFVSPLALQALSGHPLRSELFSLSEEDRISHIELADWAEVFAVAPATANLLAKLANGLADDLLTTVALATQAPLVVAPAMNVNMFDHPATQENLERLAKRGARLVGPGTGELACGWTGAGRLVDLEAIVGAIERAGSSDDLRGEVVLLSAGPTAEPIDPVRVLTNRSSGRMGFALAEAAARRGAEVVLVAGPVAQPTPAGVERVDVETAREMQDAVLGSLERATIAIFSAAVADYSVERPTASKLKRESSESLTLRLVRNPDILGQVIERRRGQTVVGFAAETEDLLANARAKLERKGCDLIVANDVSRSDIGFDVSENEVAIVGPAPEQVVEVPRRSKREVAERILDRVLEVRRG
ncbi:MAG: bifunctional phosphopantothenoylcysteine decarboxylase/phosphopantothenate--cysteine ligase CoaBC [Proteobacteria bacterium]|nr:bifunctional phosphopantothenoylcysteine decarboxylase/phosphopantothenate--cysteine ligase CoaBC [Pseudomonadota bacterium]